MDRTGILDNSESLFAKAGFHLSKRCCVRPSCFDFVARKEKQLIFVKVHPNIGNVYEKDAKGLITLAELFSGSALFVCEKTRNRPLEDDTIYSRYGVGAVTLQTLGDVLLEGIGPLIEAGPGGYYVKLDTEVIRRKRIEKELSVGKMAEIIGISRRTLYGYERNMTKTTVLTAYKLEWVLGTPVATPIDIFQYPEKAEGIFAAARRMISESRFLQFVIRKLRQFNFAVFQIGKAPFDFVARAPEETNFLGAIVHRKERNFEARTEEIVSVSKLVEAQLIFVTDSKEVSIDNLPLLCRKDFEKITCSEDLMAKL